MGPAPKMRMRLMSVLRNLFDILPSHGTNGFSAWGGAAATFVAQSDLRAAARIDLLLEAGSFIGIPRKAFPGCSLRRRPTA